MRLRLFFLLAACAAEAVAAEPPISVLFVGNSYTFGRVDPVLTYNAANVRDLTRPQGPLVVSGTATIPFTALTGTNSYPVGTINPATGTEFDSYSPHTQTNGWGGVAGIFKQFTVQAGLNYDVALSTRNAATLRGHMLNTGNANWDMRGNIASQSWNKVVMQEQSDEPLAPKTVNGVALGSNPGSFQAYVNVMENFIHKGDAVSYRDSQLFPGGNNTLRNLPANANKNAAADLYLFQTWARPNLINAPGATTIDPRTGNATYDPTKPVPSFYSNLESMTEELRASYALAAALADDDGTKGITGIAPVGQAFLRAVQQGIATRDMYGSDALTDGLIDLWFNDGTHASKWGSYLAALTLFGTLTGLDPLSLGMDEIAARDLGISREEAFLLQSIASAELAAVPEPGTIVLLALGLAVLVGLRKRAGLRAVA